MTAGTDPQPKPADPHADAGTPTPTRRFPRRVYQSLVSPRAELWAAIVAGALLFIGWAMLGLWQLEFGRPLVWTSLAIGLFHGSRAALESLRHAKFDIDVLMVIGAGLAAGMGEPEEGALLLFLFVLSGSLEALAMGRTRRAVEALSKLMPTAALVWRVPPVPDAQQAEHAAAGEWCQVQPELLRAGDRVKVLPGESVPTDAVIVEGESAMDQSTLTGESIPRVVRRGDEIFAGTINVGHPFEARVSRPASESSLQRIMQLVVSAQQRREPVQRLIDRLSGPYAISVTAASALIFALWWIVFGDAPADAAFTAMTLLIVASPCAVIIATPTATLASISRAAREGVLFKGGQSIERLARIRAMALDKTGTLTLGKPRVTSVQPVGWSDGPRLLAVAAALEQDSTHPIAAAIRDEAVARAVEPVTVQAAKFRPGHGIGGEVNGEEACLGTYDFVEDLVPVCLRARLRQLLDRAQGRGRIAVTIAHDAQAAVLVIADEPRPDAHELVASLHAEGVTPVCMFTGDNAATAEAVATRLGIDRWQAQMQPQDKVEAVEQLKAERGAVGMIGDGVNDAPVLAAADVSIAMGSIGSDAALESADIVLLADRLGVVPWAIRLARRTRTTIRVNLAFALSAIVIMALVTIIGSRMGYHMPLWVGVLGHEGGTLLVVANSLLLLLMPGAARSLASRVSDARDAETEEPDTIEATRGAGPRIVPQPNQPAPM